MLENHSEFMKRCLELAKLGRHFTAPNPMVGSVLVSEGKIISEGYHEKYGAAHAERLAIDSLKDKILLTACTLYVNLEPCSHFGNTPPCADYIIQSGIKKVVVGSKDTSEKVSGKGIEKLKNSGVEVIENVLEAECRFLNRRFFTFHEKHRPYIILKWAETADGFIADGAHNSKWISSEESRKLVHQWRAREQAILVGTNTARLDNPFLTARPESSEELSYRQPVRIVIDRSLSLPVTHNLFNTQAETLIINDTKNEKSGHIEYIKLDFSRSLRNLMAALHAHGITSLIVEGGSILLRSFIEKGLYDEIRRFKSSKTFGAGIAAPVISALPHSKTDVGGDTLEIFTKHGF
jgi:diaminohydroxyphosphoribosylaminopyrimidine deaminase/5-amino-6-(5-phosphoribosylamino)uracil reductase